MGTNTGIIAAAGTIDRLFHDRCRLTPDRTAYLQYDHSSQAWLTHRWGDVARRVGRWQAALSREALEPGARVAIHLPNGIDWVAADIAALSLGHVVVPLYVTDTPESSAYFLADCEASILFVDRAEEWQLIASHLSAGSHPQRVVHIESADAEGPAIACDDWLPEDGDLLDPAEREADDLASIIYTSGTTGPPKGVMMSHRNLLFGVGAVLDRVPSRPEDMFISFMPLAHVFERTIGYYLPMAAGCTIGYARGLKTLRDDLAVIRPTVFVAVPRVYERIYTAVHEKAGKNGLSRSLLAATLAVGWRRFEASQGRGPRPGLLDRLAWRLLSGLIPRRIAAGFGGRVRIAVSGGAVLSVTVARFFASIGLPLLQGYGLTEAGAPVTATLPADNWVDSVGPPLTGVEIETAGNGEILVRAPGVMLGYSKAPERTAEAVDADGWLHTGDTGELIDGRLYVRGRLKEIIVTSTGENVPPGTVEANIALDPLIDQAMVIGEGRPYLAALVVVNEAEWERLAGALGLDPEAAVLDRINARLSKFPRHYQVRRVRLMREAWTVDNGLLTATVKLKRAAIAERFADDVRDLYRGHDLPGSPPEKGQRTA
jgi:long-chain acyl-CoA synthetase